MRVALIGGTGARALIPSAGTRSTVMDTPYGPPSGPVLRWQQDEHEICYLPRHGPESTIPPHCVNYRANIHAVHALEPDAVVGINAVGGIHAAALPGRLVLPAQLVDYTWGREHSFEEHTDRPVQHVDFTEPFDPALRAELVAAAAAGGIDCMPEGCYAVTQGPRLETAAEIDRLERDGCDIVGMTAMPEAGLARERGLAYACCAVVVNHAAGRGPAGEGIHDQIAASIARGLAATGQLLSSWLSGR